MTRGTPRAAKKWPRSLCWKKYSKSDLLRKIVDTSWAHPTVKKSPGEPTTCFLGVFAMKIANTSGSKNQKCQKPETRNQKHGEARLDWRLYVVHRLFDNQ